MLYEYLEIPLVCGLAGTSTKIPIGMSLNIS